jgi:secondary thiamine-phosphate synthase enzyme
MKNLFKEFTLITTKTIEMINITNTVEEYISESSIHSGMAYIQSFHTTTGITVNEPLPDLESDITTFLEKITQTDQHFRHARYLHSDGQMAVNATSHLQSMMLGFEVFFPIENGKRISGSRQAIYFVELDGPQERTYCMKLIGE